MGALKERNSKLGNPDLIYGCLSFCPDKQRERESEKKGREGDSKILQCWYVSLYKHIVNAFIQRNWTIQESNKCREDCVLMPISQASLQRDLAIPTSRGGVHFLSPYWVMFWLLECRWHNTVTAKICIFLSPLLGWQPSCCEEAQTVIQRGSKERTDALTVPAESWAATSTTYWACNSLWRPG